MGRSNEGRLYVGRLSHRTRERDLEKLFSPFGRIREILLKSGFAFVEFEDHRDAEDACYDLNGRDLLGDRILVEMAKGTERGRGGLPMGGQRGEKGWMDKYGPFKRTDYRVIVENLSTRVSWQDLKDMMRKVGCEVCYADAHKHRRNEAVIEFATRSDMKRAIQKYDGHEVNGRKMQVREDRRSHSRSRSRSQSRSRSPYSRSKRSRSRSRSRDDDDDDDRRPRSGSPSAKRAAAANRDLSSRSRSTSQDRGRATAAAAAAEEVADKRSDRSACEGRRRSASKESSPEGDGGGGGDRRRDRSNDDDDDKRERNGSSSPPPPPAVRRSASSSRSRSNSKGGDDDREGRSRSKDRQSASRSPSSSSSPNGNGQRNGGDDGDDDDDDRRD